MTEFQRPTTPEPSNFVTKLRKHLKTKRVSGVRQVGNDRILVIEFNNGLYFLVLEFFSAGNVVLLDEKRQIIALQRLVAEHEHNDKYAVGAQYNAFDESLFGDEPADIAPEKYESAVVESWITELKNQDQKPAKKQKPLSISRACFSKASHLSFELIQRAMADVGLDPSQKALDTIDFAIVSKAMNKAQDDFASLLKSTKDGISGYILSKRKSQNTELEYLPEEFYPFKPMEKTDFKLEAVEGYNKTLDKFFTSIESSKDVLRQQQQELTSQKRLQQVKDENMAKVAQLENSQALNIQKGEAIMMNSDLVDSCKEAILSLLSQQMDWQNIEKLIQMEQKRKHAVACRIALPLNLQENKISVLLPHLEEDADSDSDEDESFLKVIIDLNLSAFANASLYFDAKKNAQQKQLKTEQNADMAIKNTERRILKDQRSREKESKASAAGKQLGIRELRTHYWFEKFYWFVSSDGYLCVAGRDTAQVDFLYYRYFNNDSDFLVSNDLEKSLKVVIQNPYKNKDIPPTTFIQAGTFSFAPTKAWDNKIVTSAWYVQGKHVSKRDFDGSLLPPGLLKLKEDKTFLPPVQLVLGIGFLWVGDAETADRYKEARKARDQEMGLKVVDDSSSSQIKAQELKKIIAKMSSTISESPSAAPEQVDDSPSEKAEEESTKPSPASSPAPTSNVRGKKAKLKKIKQKYGDQDEEERKLRMSVLGTLKQVEKHSEKDSESQNDGESKSAQDLKWKIQRKKTAELNQLRRTLEDLELRDEEKEEGESDKSDYWLPSMLLPSPKAKDNIVDCIPVFAPWSALNKYKYKAKVTPGSNKKGKSLSEAIELFSRYTAQQAKDATNEEWIDRDNLIATSNQQEFLMNIIVSKLKIAPAAGSEGLVKGKSCKGGKKK